MSAVSFACCIGRFLSVHVSTGWLCLTYFLQFPAPDYVDLINVYVENCHTCTNHLDDISLILIITFTWTHLLFCNSPKDTDADEDSFPDEEVETLYKDAFSDLSIDQKENAELVEFFSKCPKSKIVSTRAAAFKHACDFLSDDNDTNTSLIRINVMVHALETTCMVPKPYELREEVSPAISVAEIGLDASISKAVQHLLGLDVNRLDPGENYVINVQSGKKPYWAGDDADEPLFTRVNERELQRPTYKTFIALLDNYSAECGEDEVITRAESVEIWAFLKAIYQTAPIQFAHKYLVANSDGVPSDPAEFLQLLKKIWFDLYFRERGGRPDSSGFEHVFVGEIKEKNGEKEVSGFHNWVQVRRMISMVEHFVSHVQLFSQNFILFLSCSFTSAKSAVMSTTRATSSLVHVLMRRQTLMIRSLRFSSSGMEWRNGLAQASSE